MTKLRTAQAARDDIRDIRRFSKSTFGVRVARDYLGGLIDVFNLIEANPRIGALDSELGENIRSFGYRSHRIYYVLEGDDVLVVRILHQSRDKLSGFEAGQ